MITLIRAGVGSAIVDGAASVWRTDSPGRDHRDVAQMTMVANAGWHGGGWWPWLSWLMLLAISIAFAAAVVWLVRHGGSPGVGRGSQTQVDRRACGEIGTEEYQQRRRALEGCDG